MSELTVQDDHILVTGTLTFSTVSAVLKSSDPLFQSLDALKFNLEAVEQCDSAGLALLISWLRRGEQSKKAVSFYHLPKQLTAFAKVAGVEHLLERAA